MLTSTDISTDNLAANRVTFARVSRHAHIKHDKMNDRLIEQVTRIQKWRRWKLQRKFALSIWFEWEEQLGVHKSGLK